MNEDLSLKELGEVLTDLAEYLHHISEVLLKISEKTTTLTARSGGETLSGFIPRDLTKQFATGKSAVKAINTRTEEVLSFESIMEGSRITRASTGNIRLCLKKVPGYKTAGGYRWEYI